MVLGSTVKLPDYFRQVVNGLQVSKVCSSWSNAPSSPNLLEGRWSGTRLSSDMFLHCPEQITLSTYDLIMLDFTFFHNSTDSQEKRGFLCVKLQLGIWCEVCQGFWKATGAATVDFLAQFLSVFWVYLLLRKSDDYENTTLFNTHSSDERGRRKFVLTCKRILLLIQLRKTDLSTLCLFH